MKKTLRVLVIEDSEFDAELLLSTLRRGGYEPAFERVENAEGLKAALHSNKWDVILADYSLPQFSAPAALAILHESGLDVPFIIVSGSIREDTAVAAMKAGAHDYLMKENLVRLIPAVERELREAANREGKRITKEALRESELRYRLLWETATDAIILIDTDSIIHFANPAVMEVFGYRPDEVIGKSLTTLQPESLRQRHLDGLNHYLTTGVKRLNWRATETVGLRKDGTEIPIEVAFSDMDFQGRRWFVGFIRDVSERKRTERELQENKEQFQIARDIQQHLFPRQAPDLPGFEIAGASQPAGATGGDYFDYLPMFDNRWGIVIGDVTGHGIGPALLMAETRAYLRILAKDRADVGEILTQVNRVLDEDLSEERFVTLLLAQLVPESHTLTYVNAGHPAGFVLSLSGDVKALLKRSGPPLGLRPDARYTTCPAIPLAPGDLVLLLTDGFEEALAADDDCFGMDRALKVVRENREASAPSIVQALYNALRKFSDTVPQADDLTVIIIKVKSNSAEGG
jgi:sigma-B regulation protein RsbU (phosphoserine phosphatase)